jgi:hypothetical protein
MQKDNAINVSKDGSLKEGPSLDERQAQEEGKAPTVSKPGGFQNDPDDPTNPNEVRERHNRKLRR